MEDLISVLLALSVRTARTVSTGGLKQDLRVQYGKKVVSTGCTITVPLLYRCKQVWEG